MKHELNWPQVNFGVFLKPNSRPYTLGASEDANLVGMRLYGAGPFHRELKPAIKIAKKSHFVIRQGDVIYNKLFAWKGTFGIVPAALDEMFVSDKFPTYELDRGMVDDRFLGWYFRCASLWEQARLMSTGSAALSKLTLNPPKFLLLTMPVPPLPEQRRIVDKIEELSAKIEEARNIRHKAIDEAQLLFSAAIDPVIDELSRKYEVKSLINLVEPDRGISYGVVLTGSPVAHGIPTLRAGNLQKFRVVMNDVKKIDPNTEARYRRTRLRGNELLLRIRGGLGEVAECPREMIGGNVSREIAVIPFTDKVLPRYGMYVLAAPTNQSRMNSHLRGTSYQGINLKDVRTLLVAVPQIQEQRRIVAYLDELQGKVDSLKQLQKQTAEELNALMPSILSKAFAGEL